MYEKLWEALLHHSGGRSFDRVVEYGDTKDLQSGRGIEANRANKQIVEVSATQPWLDAPRLLLVG